MNVKRSREPVLWALFGGGGMMAALFLPVLLVVLFLGAPLGWVDLIAFSQLQALVRHPLVRLGLFGLVFLSLFHWAHRFRYTLYDGLQLSHLNELIAVLTYGFATILTVVGAVVLWGVG
jgi:fumarate reductase subunit D